MDGSDGEWAASCGLFEMGFDEDEVLGAMDRLLENLYADGTRERKHPSYLKRTVTNVKNKVLKAKESRKK